MVEDLHLYWVWSSVEGEGGRTIGRNRSGGRQPQPGESDSSERPSVTRGGPKVCSTRRQRLQSADVSVFFHRRAHSLRATTKKIAASTHLMILFGRRGRASGRIIMRIQAIGMIHFRWPDAHSLQSVTGSFIQIETFPNHFLCDSIASHVTDCRESPWWYLGHLDLAENAKVFAIYFHSINHVTAKRPIRWKLQALMVTWGRFDQSTAFLLPTSILWNTITWKYAIQVHLFRVRRFEPVEGPVTIWQVAHRTFEPFGWNCNNRRLDNVHTTDAGHLNSIGDGAGPLDPISGQICSSFVHQSISQLLTWKHHFKMVERNLTLTDVGSTRCVRLLKTN